MTIFKCTFAGTIHGIHVKEHDQKINLTLSICKKNYTKEGEEPTFTWIKVRVWNAPDWMANKATKGAWCCGVGDMSMAKWTDKDGKDHHDIEVRASSYDLDINDGPKPAAEPKQAPQKVVPPPADLGDDEPPF